MATSTWTGAGVDNLASTNLNWDSAPGSGDDLVFDGAFPVTGSKNCTFDSATTYGSVNVQSGYTGTVTPSANMTITNALTLNGNFNNSTNNKNITVGSVDASGSATRTVSMGSGTWTVNGSGATTDISGSNLTWNKNTSTLTTVNVSHTFKSGTQTYYNISLGAGIVTTLTLTDDLTATNTLDYNFGANTLNINGSGKFLVAQGDISPSSSGTLAGTAGLKISGGANQAWTMKSIFCDININKSANTLSLSGILDYDVGTITYVAGTVSPGTSKVRLTNSTCTFNTGTMPWFDFNFNNGVGGPTTTLTSNLTVTGTLSINDPNAGTVTINGFKIMLSGDCTTAANGIVNGTTVIEFTGAANQTWSSSRSSNDQNLSVIINKSGNTLTLSGTIRFGTGTLTYTAGTVDGSTSTFKTTDSTINAGTLPFNNFTTDGGTTTLTGNLSVLGTLTNSTSTTLSCGSNTLTLAGNFTKSGTFTAGTSTVVFNGTSTVAGTITFNNLTINNTKTVHLTSTQTFTVGGAFTTSGTSTLDATTGASMANLVINGTQSVAGVAATDIDSSGGNTVHNIGGTNTNTVNWDTAAPGPAVVSIVPRRKLRTLLGVGL